MKSIKERKEKEIIIKNSRFITILFKINSSNIESFLKEVKEKYPKATHYCYAYIYEEDRKFSDDNEPGGTAGMPMLNVLEKENLNHILAVTVRYFGGIKLGAGGLVRAYTKSMTEALKETEYITLEKGNKIKLTLDYKDEKEVAHIIEAKNILRREYQEKITYIALIEQKKLKDLSRFSYEILEDTYIEKSS